MDTLQEKITKEGLSVVRLDHPSGSKCLATLFGGHVVSFQDFKGNEYLFLSSKAIFTGKKAIRGGTPVIFPQFGPGKLPQHGFARNSMWTLDQPPMYEKLNDATTAELKLEDNEETYSVWPHHFELKLKLTLYSTKLAIELCCTNTDCTQFEFTSALHTYFKIPDIHRVSIVGKGLEGCSFVAYEDLGDDLPLGTIRTQTKDEIVFNGYLDRNYYDPPEKLKVITERDTQGGKNVDTVVIVEKSDGFKDCVVWNPWKERADKMADMGLDEWVNFVCIEAAAVRYPINLEPGQSWRASQTVSGIAVPSPKL